MRREEGHYTVKRVDELPKRGNFNFIYIKKDNPIEAFYLWTDKAKYDKITLSGSGGETVDITNKLDRGGYVGTAQDIVSLIPDIQVDNGLTINRETDVIELGGTLTRETVINIVPEDESNNDLILRTSNASGFEGGISNNLRFGIQDFSVNFGGDFISNTNLTVDLAGVSLSKAGASVEVTGELVLKPSNNAEDNSQNGYILSKRDNSSATEWIPAPTGNSEDISNVVKVIVIPLEEGSNRQGDTFSTGLENINILEKTFYGTALRNGGGDILLNLIALEEEDGTYSVLITRVYLEDKQLNVEEDLDVAGTFSISYTNNDQVFENTVQVSYSGENVPIFTGIPVSTEVENSIILNINSLDSIRLQGQTEELENEVDIENYPYQIFPSFFFQNGEISEQEFIGLHNVSNRVPIIIQTDINTTDTPDRIVIPGTDFIADRAVVLYYDEPNA